MRSFRDLTLWQKAGLIAGVLFWGIVIIGLEFLLYPFLRRTQDVRRTVFQKPHRVSRLRLTYAGR